MYQYPKKFLSVEQLIQKLIDSGMIITSLSEARTTLTTIGYYRLKGYSFHKFDSSIKKYVKNTTFSDVLKLYYFDSELSHLIFSYLTQIEIALRTRLINSFQIMLSMKYLSPTKESWDIFIYSFKQLLGKYSGIYDICSMNFPDDWEYHF